MSSVSVRTSQRTHSVAILKINNDECLQFTLVFVSIFFLFLSDFNQHRNISTNFNKLPKREASQKLAWWQSHCPMTMEERPSVTRRFLAFCSCFANGLKQVAACDKLMCVADFVFEYDFAIYVSFLCL